MPDGDELDLRRLFESAPGCFLVLAPDSPRFTIIAVTDAYLEATRAVREEILGRGVFEVFPDNPDEPSGKASDYSRASLNRVLEHCAPDQVGLIRYDIRRPDSEGGGFEERHWEVVNFPVMGPDGRVACLIHRVEDVTESVRLNAERFELESDQRSLRESRLAAINLMEDALEAHREAEQVAKELRREIAERLQAEKELFQSEERFRVALRNAPVILAAQDRDLVYTWAYNTRTSDAAEVVGQTDQDLFPQEAPALTALKSRVIRAGEVVHEQLWIHRLGRRLFLDLSLEPMRNEAGDILGVWMVAVDMTAVKETEEALRASEERLQLALKSAGVSVYEVNRQQQYVWVRNPHPGAQGQDVTGKSAEELFSAAAVERVVQLRREVMESGEPAREEITLPIFGDTRTYDYSVEPVRDDSGRVSGALVAALDVTERKAAEESRKKYEDSLSSLLSAVGRMGLFERQNAWLVLPIGVVLQIVVFYGLGLFDSPSDYLGIPGAAAALIGVVVAIVAGPAAGVAVALVGGMAYLAFLTDLGSTVGTAAIVLSILLWMLAAASAGLAGDWVRRIAFQRERLLGQTLAERTTLTDSLEAANERLRRRNEQLIHREEELRAQAEALVSQHGALEVAQAETARLLEEQKDLFRRLQEALLDIPRELPGVSFGHLYRSATREALVGGDFYDVFEVRDNRLALLIGDVSGHGVEAARIASLVKDTVHAFAHQFKRPQTVLERTNELLIEKRVPWFVTLFLGILDPQAGFLAYGSAGHPNVLVRGRDGDVRPLEAGSAPLGVYPGHAWHEREEQLGREDLLLLYTDGAIEARHGGSFFGLDGLSAILRGWQDPSPERLPQAILDSVLSFSAGELTDDVALLAVKLTPVSGDCEEHAGPIL